MRGTMTRVMATGTFDILHPGHLLYLERSRALGDELVVVVARDINVKHKPRPVVPEDQRLRMVSALKMVDMAVLGSVTDIFEPVRALRPDIITLGYDQYMDENWLEGELRKRGLMARVVRISEREPCELCSSRQIVEKILKERC
ncbi:MAG: FAD synthase [Methanothrix sp.]|uniref:FAD synthase n=2 Tax=Methanotrichaceae TaxID=143067 RepID=RIBL_METTP|nr:RecName: Full=FAD synthase; AltName: Full=FMN adenylyltransferase; AltName: Full=Flavin adenine dinucleotide synthase [Methanothrix thermoacetophila PT]ABK14580.1 FMN adenylyltransferase [Methanothrix thermoacetophila PT]MBC7080569.1 FAD synthase [Methanothrix sp.]NPU87397.1 FAD synthase [Methanothrix sp.]